MARPEEVRDQSLLLLPNIHLPAVTAGSVPERGTKCDGGLIKLDQLP